MGFSGFPILEGLAAHLWSKVRKAWCIEQDLLALIDWGARIAAASSFGHTNSHNSRIRFASARAIILQDSAATQTMVLLCGGKPGLSLR